MAKVGASWVSDELQIELAKLTAQQAKGVLRIVQAEIEGRTLSSLLDCPGQICTSTTYYGYESKKKSKKGWRDKPEFTRSLELARRDIRKWMLENGVNDALTLLAGTAPQAARSLRQQVVGDEEALAALIEMVQSEDGNLRLGAAIALGETGLPAAVPALRVALVKEGDPAIRKMMLAALGAIAGLRDGDRRLAAIGILDRADIRTAAKQALAINDEDVDAAIERELARLATGSQGANVESPEGDANTEDDETGNESTPVDTDTTEAPGPG